MLVVEDGTGLPNSNAYISVSEFDAYALQRNINISAYDTTKKEGAISTCTLDFMDVYYCYKGDKLNDDQALSLPTDLVSINKDVKNSCANGALLHLQGLLLVDATKQSQLGDIKSSKSVLKGLDKEVEYFEGSQQNYKRSTPVIDRLLNPYLCFGGGIKLLVS